MKKELESHQSDNSKKSKAFDALMEQVKSLSIEKDAAEDRVLSLEVEIDSLKKKEHSLESQIIEKEQMENLSHK